MAAAGWRSCAAFSPALNMRISGYVLLLISAGAGFPASAAAGPDPPPRSHDEAIDLARSGEFDEALGILWALREADPDDLRLLYDETVVLAWAGQDDRVLRNAKLIDLGAAPAYVLSAVAKSARNMREFDSAASWYSILVGRDAADLDARLGLAMTHADAGKPGEAWLAISAAPDDQRNAVRLRLTEAYVCERQGRFMEALARYQGVLEAAPGNRAALRGKALLLRMALLPSEALALAREHPGILDDLEVVQLEADVAALEVRHGAQTAYPPSRRHEGTDRALAHIDALLARPDLDPAVRLRLRYDRIVALTDRLRMPEAIADFEALAADPEDVPAYVLREVGRAYLHEREPEQATRVLALALAQDPDDTDAKVQLFFAYSDLHQPGRALGLAESLLAGLDPTRQVTGSAVVKGNETYLQAAVLAGLARAYADRLAESQEYFEQLRARYPHNSDIRQELANVYRWRGWLDRSLAEYAQVLAVEPDRLSARVGYAHTRLDSRDYLAVERELRALSEHYGDERAVQDLAKRWQAHERSELSLDARAGESSGQTFGEDQYRVDAVWLSRPIARRYRALVYTHDAFAEFPEGEARRRRLGAGMEYRYGRWQARARLSADRSGGDAGVRASFDYRLSDLLSIGGIVETESDATPLRGERVGVSSRLVELRAVYARHESTALRAALSHQDLSDGNSGGAVFLGAEQRLVNRPGYKLTLIGELGLEDRSRDDVAYFSPRRGFTWTTGMRNDWLMFRRYGLGLMHGITAEFGQYDQSGFDAGDIWSLGYEFRADLNERWQARLGFTRRSNVYDGGREYSSFVLAGFNGRF